SRPRVVIEQRLRVDLFVVGSVDVVADEGEGAGTEDPGSGRGSIAHAAPLRVRGDGERVEIEGGIHELVARHVSDDANVFQTRIRVVALAADVELRRGEADGEKL